MQVVRPGFVSGAIIRAARFDRNERGRTILNR